MNRTYQIIAIIVFALILIGQAYYSVYHRDTLSDQWKTYDFSELPDDIYP